MAAIYNGNEAKTPSGINWQGFKLIITGISVLVALCFVWIRNAEPTDEPQYVDVAINSYHTGLKRSGYFVVKSATTSEKWEVNAGDSEFDSGYIGHAVLAISKGRWTGLNHYKLLYSRPAPDAP